MLLKNAADGDDGDDDDDDHDYVDDDVSPAA